MKLDWFELVQKSSQNRHNLDVGDTPTPLIISVTTGYMRPISKCQNYVQNRPIPKQEFQRPGPIILPKWKHAAGGGRGDIWTCVKP